VLRAFWIAMALGTAGLLLQIVNDGWDGTTKFWVIAAFFGILAVLVVWVYRSATVTTPRYLAIQGLLRTRRILWADVQAISIESNPGSFAQSNAPKQIVAVYDGTGKRRPLPHLNEKTFEKRYGSLESEVDAIRAAWLRHRGDGWTPVAAAQVKAQEIAHYGVNSWTVGLGWGSLSILVALVFFLVGLFGDVTAPWPLSLLFAPEGLLVLPVVTFFVVSIASLVLRRRARAQAAAASGGGEDGSVRSG
jgi:hypothetical protein